MIMALTLGASAVGGERSRKTWDNLRVTEFGAGLALRARWAGILYRLRAPITLILLVRFLLIAGILYDLTAFGGLYPKILGAQAKPPLPEWRLDLLLIAFAVTVNILLPILQVAAVRPQSASCSRSPSAKRTYAGSSSRCLWLRSSPGIRCRRRLGHRPDDSKRRLLRIDGQ